MVSHTIYKNTELADMVYSQAVVPNNIMKGFKLLTLSVPFNEKVFSGGKTLQLL